MHTKRIILGLALPLMAWSVASCKPIPPLIVAIKNGCSSAGSVQPDTAFLVKGQDIEWQLSDSSTAAGFTIEPKGASWPWQAGRRFSGRKGALETATGPASSMKPDPKGTHPYQVLLICPDTTNARIDPTIIIPK
jgi:hypothetical protein